MNKLSLAALILLLSFSQAGAGGFGINVHGIKSMGMAGNTAMAQDASVLYAHPAGISHITNSFTAGFNALYPSISFLSPSAGNIDMDPALSLPFHAYATRKINEKFTLGVGINTPFSENMKWEDDWTGRYVIISNRIKTLFLQPTASYQLGEKFSVAAGLIAGWAQSKQVKAIDLSANGYPFVKSELKANGLGFGFNAGLFFNTEKISLAASYRSEVKFDLDGDATYEQLSQGGTIAEGIPTSATYTTELNMPSSITGSFVLRITEKLHAGIQAVMTDWEGTGQKEYIFDGNEHLNQVIAEINSNTITIAAGAQYNYNERTWLRAGIGFGQNTVESGYVTPAHPDSDNAFYSLGLTWLWKENLSLDMAVMMKDYASRSETANIPYKFNGDYKSTIYSAGIGINYEF